MVLIDDHEMVAESLALALQREGVSVVARAATLESGMALVSEHRPDVVLLDFRLPDGDGLDGLRRIKADLPGTAVLVLTAVADDRTAAAVMAAGAAGFLTKDLAVQDLVGAVAAAAAGQTVVAPELLGPMLARIRAPLSQPGATLTAREHDVLRLLADGLGVDDIAASLTISRNTTRKHVQAVLNKLGGHSQLEAVAIARREGLLQSD